MSHGDGGVIDALEAAESVWYRGRAYVLRTKVKDEDGVKGGMGNLLVGHCDGGQSIRPIDELSTYS